MVIAQNLLNFVHASLTFDVVVHVATLCAVIIFFRKDLSELLKSFFVLFNYKVSWQHKREYCPTINVLILLIIATIPTGLIGFFGRDFFESLFKSTQTTTIALMCNGTLLILCSWFLRKSRISENSISSLLLSPKTIFIVLLIGTAQGIAIIPGISRSGLTIVCALIMGFSLTQAFAFSFLLSIPAILGALLLELSNVTQISNYAPYIVGFLSAFIVGLFSLALFRLALLRGYLRWFGYYCLIIGAFFFYKL